MQTLGGFVFVALVVLLVVLLVKKSRHDLGALATILTSLEGQWVTVEIGGMGGRITTVATLTGDVKRVADDRLYIDARPIEPDVLQRLVLGPVHPEDGIPLERIQAVRGPRGTVHWP